MTPAQQKEALELLEHARNALRQPNMDSALAILIDELFIEVGYPEKEVPPYTGDDFEGLEDDDDDDDPFS